MAKKHMILFLAANPRDTGRLALDREAHAIHAELKCSGYRDRFEFETRWAAEPLDLLRGLREFKPTVVHFSGHGGAGIVGAPGVAGERDVADASAPAGGDPHGLYFHDAVGGHQLVSPEAIAQAFGAAGAPVKLVVLNACFTEPIAKALLVHVDCVVGMTGAIHDDAARSFAIGFYGGLGEHESIAAAFEQGRAAIHLDGLPDADRPQLQVRAGFDASQLILAAVAPLLRIDLPCPYPGMRPYTADDAAAFHGRAAEVDELIGRLRADEREIYVIGPSGSGKSSLVSAGVLPRLARGVTGLGRFVVRELRPGEHPAARLAEALDVPAGEPLVTEGRVPALLAHRGPRTSLLLVVDQLEELFTMARVDERDRFLAALRDLQVESRCTVIFTLRADFFGALMESPLWAERHGQLSRIEVSPLRGDALREAIIAPARNLGVVVEPELVERLLADAASEPGVLPLLQETMVQLWDQRADQSLTLTDYRAMGDSDRSGLAVAVARRADATLRKFTRAQAAIGRRILLRLISFDEGRSDTRRQQPTAALRAVGDNDDDFDYVLQTMIADRLLTIDEDDGGGSKPRVDLGHEVLIAAWPTLAGWIQRHRLDEQRRREFGAAATRWVENGRGARGLLDQVELKDAEAWQQTESASQVGQSADVIALIAASRTAQISQLRRRRRLLRGGVAVLAVFAGVVTFLAIAARREANHAKASDREKQLQVARLFEELGRQLVVEKRYQEAVPYLLEARRNNDNSAPLKMMFWAVTRHLPLVPALEHRRFVLAAAFSPDSTRVITTSYDNTARIWDAVTGNPIGSPLTHHGPVSSAAFSPDGTRVVTASWDKTARLWSAVSGKPITTLEHQDQVESVVFSRDGARVATASADKTARVWDAATGKPITGPLEHQGVVRSAVFSPDGTRVVTASYDRTARVWDAASGKLLISPLEHQAQVWSAVFSPDGTRIVTASEDRTARVWDAATGKLLVGFLDHAGSVMSAAFSPDGNRIVTGSEDKTARVWDAATGKPLTKPLDHQGLVTTVVFSLDGTRVLTASDDGTARVWDARSGKPVTSPLEHQDRVIKAAFSADGTRIVTASYDGTARIWDAGTGKPLVSPLEHRARVAYATFSPDGTLVATASHDGTARVWETATGNPVTGPLEHQGQVASVAFSPNGTHLVTASWDGTARIWETATGKLSRSLEHTDPVMNAAFSVDSTYVVTASFDGTARIWDAATGKPITSPLEHRAEVVSAGFSPDGTRVVTASRDGTARVWDAATGKPITGSLAHQGALVSAAFSPDGTRVVTASWDKTARVWDAATGKPITRSLEHQAEVVSAVFSPDGTRVVTASWDKTARVWDAATGKPITSALEHQRAVHSAAFSCDGSRVVTTSEDKTARLWDAATGKPLTSPFEHQGAVWSVAFSPDGNQIVTASEDGTARLWDIRLDEGTLDQWSEMAKRSPFVLRGIAHERRSALWREDVR